MAEGRVNGKIVRVVMDRNFGFVRIDNQRGDYFFHRDDFKGEWEALVNHPKELAVTCVVVESPKGPRVGDVTPI